MTENSSLYLNSQTLETADFASRDDAEGALCAEGYTTNGDDDVWRSPGGVIDAVIKQRTSDNRYIVVLYT